MRKASLDLQLELPLSAAAAGDQLALPLQDSPVSYRLRRSDRNSIRVMVEDGVLSVSAPRHLRLPAIEAAVRGRGSSALPSPAHLPALPRTWGDGVSFPFLGDLLTLRLSGAATSNLAGRSLELALPPNASSEQIRDAVHGWLQSQAHRVIGEMLAKFRCPPRWTLSFSRSMLNMTDADGCVRLNWRLVLLSRESIARLLAHACAQTPDKSAQIDLLAD